MKTRLNCWLYMLWLLFRLKGRATFFVERVGPGGLIPHTGLIQKRGSSLTFIEYKATNRKRSFFDRDGSNIFLFHGAVQVTEYQMTGRGSGETLQDARTALINDGGPEYDAHMG